jgi:hypothetical protein
VQALNDEFELLAFHMNPDLDALVSYVNCQKNVESIGWALTLKNVKGSWMC